MYDKYGGWSFIVHWNIPNDPKYKVNKNEKEWQTLTYIDDRYEIIFSQDVLLQKNGGLVIKPIRKPLLLVREIRRIYGDPYASSMDFTDFQITIEGEKLDKLVKSNWDFSVIGINLKTWIQLTNATFEV